MSKLYVLSALLWVYCVAVHLGFGWNYEQRLQLEHQLAAHLAWEEQLVQQMLVRDRDLLTLADVCDKQKERLDALQEDHAKLLASYNARGDELLKCEEKYAALKKEYDKLCQKK